MRSFEWELVKLWNYINFSETPCILDITININEGEGDMICGAFNKFQDFFVQSFKIGIDSWKFTMLLLYILWDDWPIFMISRSNEQLQQ